ncbi:MAG: leucine zipper domain-containing protein [Gammaproteobacteria bacterium]
MNPDDRAEAALTELTADQRDEALARFAVLKPHLEDGVSLRQAASEAGVAVRTAQRWLDKYRSAGLLGLARSTRSDRHRRKLAAEAVDIALKISRHLSMKVTS